MIGFYYGSNYLDRKHSFKNLLLFFGFVTLGILSKLPSGYILTLFVFLFSNKNIATKPKIVFAFVTMVSLLIISTWYFYWVPYLVSTYGFWHFFMGKSISQGMHEIAANLPQTLKSFYDGAIKYIGFALFLFGLFHAFRKKNLLVGGLFLVAFAGFILVVFKSGFNFPHHTYYIIPFVPVMALICGFGLGQINNNKVVTILLIAIGIEGILTQQHDFRLKKENRNILTIENELEKVSAKNDLILINSGEYPTPLYFAHRKGWLADNKEIADTNYINSLQDKGLKYIVVLKKVFGSDVKICYKPLIITDDFTIYKLNKRE
jgi:hypothetical protein